VAPPELQICERCRRLNAIELREFFAAVTVIARVELDELGRRVVFPFRVPITNVDAARLARAARELQEAAQELELAELRRSPRKGPKRVERTQGEKRWNESSRVKACDRARRHPRGR